MQLTRRRALRSVGVGIGMGGLLIATADNAAAVDVSMEVSAPAEADVGEEVDIIATVDMPHVRTTPGEEADFKLFVDGSQVDSTEKLLIADGDEYEVEFERAFEEPGEREVTVEAEGSIGGDTYTKSDSDTITIIGEVTVSGAALPVPPALTDEIADIREDGDDLPPEEAVILTESDATLVLTDSDVESGTAEATGTALDSPVEFDGLTLDVLVGSEFDLDTSVTEIALDDLSGNTDEYAFEHVSVPGTHLSTAVRRTPDGESEGFPTSTGALVESGPERAETFGDIDSELYSLLDEPTSGAVDELIPADEPSAFTVAFGEAFWTTAEATVTGIVLPAGTAGREFINSADVEDVSHANASRPLLYWTAQEYDTTEIEDISTIQEMDGEYVSLEADVWGQRVSTKQTMEETTGCGPDQVQFERGCIDIIFDVLLHGGAAWTDQPQTETDVAPLLGVSAHLQETAVDDQSGTYEIIAEVVDSSRIHADLPDGEVLLVSEMQRVGDSNFDSLSDDEQALITTAGDDVIENWAQQVNVDGESIEISVDLAAYANDEGVVEANGVFEAIDDWREGEIMARHIFDVIDAWRSEEPVN